ncbi:hypothetical protein G1K75_12540 [Tenacibaculum finnmarkense]|uniref:hypothetical protein n=1 Tax=Tenacibaculum finnmarkense TaxID=2781243 RepID=UPI001EFAF783|nr:hypothetical protein [Tenacibaculum finnmarkense]MCG8806479.1 hypothetical protein [Tenacibaculum finnmarkense]MCG8857611.1 hypothetical protein [Tenacibaculum finnmarkense]
MKKFIGIILIIGCMFFGGFGASIGNGFTAVIFCLSSLIIGFYLLYGSEKEIKKPSLKKEFEKKQIINKNYNSKAYTENKLLDKNILKKTDNELLSHTIFKPNNENKFVNYSSTLNNNENSYPVLKIPAKNCIVRTHKYGATKRKGFKDQSFEKSISTFFSNKYEVSGNVRLNTGKSTRPFEPDIAIICSTSKNIRIDIEIDEPYAGITRQSIHCKGEDVNRDNYFRDRGWIVIRFSEYQVHTKEIECLNFIALVINSIDNFFQIPNNLQAVLKIQNEILWDIVQAQKWEKENYRENYLNHTFSKLTEHKGTTKRDFDKREEEEEKLVKPTSLDSNDKGKNIGFNKTNTNKRDKRIKFNSEEHNYTIDGVPAPSVTTIISRFFPEFDAVGKASNLSSRNPLYGLPVNDIVEIWKDRGIEAANKGTFLHEQIENYYLQQPYEETEEFYQFLNFVKDHNHLKPYRSEWRIFDETHNIAGTIDLLVENDNGSFDIYDWKRSKKVINPFNGQVVKNDRWGNIGIGILQHIDDTSYNKYELQQNLYRQILEENYGIKINNMYLIVMHTDEGYTNYHKVRVPHLTNEINSILQTV